jgi:hypothetical protein
MASDNGASEVEEQENLSIEEQVQRLNSQNRDLKKKLDRINAERTQKTIQTARMMRESLSQFGGERDLSEVFGYKQRIDFDDLIVKFRTNPLARAIVLKPVITTWKGRPDIVEVNEKGEELADEEKSDFESDVQKLIKNLDLWEVFLRADVLSRIGRYGVILIGTGDLTATSDFARELPDDELAGPEMVNYLTPFHYGDADIAELVDNVADPRFGQIKRYGIFNEVPQTTKETSESDDSEEDEFDIEAHYTRVIHIAENALTDDVLGTPALEPVFNYLMDMDKVIGSAAESFYQMAKPNLQFDVDPEAEDVDWDKLNEDIDAFMMDYLRSLRTQGVDVERIGGEAVDPEPAFNVISQMISTGTPMNKRTLFGNLTGERASTEDRRQFQDRIRTRREHHVTPNIIRSTIGRLMDKGAVTEARYKVEWPEIDPLNELEESKVNLNKAKTAQAAAPLGDTNQIFDNIDEARELVGLGLSDIEAPEAPEDLTESEQRDQVVGDLTGEGNEE